MQTWGCGADYAYNIEKFAETNKSENLMLTVQKCSSRLQIFWRGDIRVLQGQEQEDLEWKKEPKKEANFFDQKNKV